MINNLEEIKNVIITSASQMFYERNFYTVSVKDICVKTGIPESDILNIYCDIKHIYEEVIDIGQKDYFNHPIFDASDISESSAKSKIDSFIERQIFHMREKENWCTKTFAKELLLPSKNLSSIISEIIFQKMSAALASLGIYTNLEKNDPLLLMTFTQCFAPGLRLIALSNSEYLLLKPLLMLPKNELHAYLRTFVFSGLDGIRCINLSLEIT